MTAPILDTRLQALEELRWHVGNTPLHTMLRMMVRAAKEEGLLISPSSAANLAGALKLAENIEEGVIVTVLPDDGRKYVSLDLKS